MRPLFWARPGLRTLNCNSPNRSQLAKIFRDGGEEPRNAPNTQNPEVAPFLVLVFRVFRGFLFGCGFAALLSMCPLAAHAQLALLPDQEPAQVFGGDARTIQLTWHNPGQERFSRGLSARLYQATSATAVPLGTTSWKTLDVLPGQTVIESARLNFPAVNAETRFVIQWLAGANQVVGTTEVLVYPTNLLKELKPLAGEDPLGVLDPQNRLKPLLKAAAVEFRDLEDAGVEGYRGKLVIAGPFQSQKELRNGLATQLQALANKGAGLVWLLPPPEREERRPGKLRPSFYIVPEGKGAVVVAQASLIAGLSEKPQAQLNLIECARLALHPEAPRLPEATP
jgi:hypothetical protein